MKCLKAVHDHGPKGAYIAAGFVRNRFWDSIYSQSGVIADADIDVIYHDESDVSQETERQIEANLTEIVPAQTWQVRNQARMHRRGGYASFDDVAHAMTHWPEVATAVAVRYVETNNLECLAPFGLSDLYKHILRITPIMKATDPDTFDQRFKSKGWLMRWPQLRVIH